MGSTASADFDSWSEHVGASVERKYKLGGSGTTFVPSVRADFTNISSDGYTETGAGVWDLQVDSIDTQELIFGLDGKFMHPLNDTVTLTGNLGVGFDAINDQNSITSSFVGGGASFVTRGMDPSPWIGRGGLGVTSQFNGVEVTVRYDLEGRQDFTDQTASLKLRAPF
jgi:outer membrane autotransporter protein